MSRKLDDWIDGFLQYTENSEPPLSYRLWTAISVVAACMQRKVWLSWEGKVFPNLYVVLVGPSGCRKGTAMRPGRSLLDEVGISLSAEAVTREALIRRISKSGEFDPGTDAINMHSSMTIFSEELTVFLGYSNVLLMSHLCNWFDCQDRWTYETKHQGTDAIRNIWVNLIGATTPSLIQSTLPQDAVGGGLTSRMIFVYERDIGKIVVDPFETEKEREIRKLLVSDAEDIMLTRGEFKFKEGFMDRWISWYPAQKKEGKTRLKDPRLAGYIERRPTHILKLSMIVNASRSDGDMTLTSGDFDRAVSILESAEVNMSDTFRGVGKSDLSEVLTNVMSTLATNGEMTKAALLRMYYHDADEQEMQRIIDTLVAMHYCTYSIKNQTITYKGEEDVK